MINIQLDDEAGRKVIEARGVRIIGAGIKKIRTKIPQNIHLFLVLIKPLSQLTNYYQGNVLECSLRNARGQRSNIKTAFICMY